MKIKKRTSRNKRKRIPKDEYPNYGCRRKNPMKNPLIAKKQSNSLKSFYQTPKGKKQAENHSKFMTGRTTSRKGLTKFNCPSLMRASKKLKGKKFGKRHKDNLKKAAVKRFEDPKEREKARKRMKGKKPWNTGKKRKPKTIKKIKKTLNSKEWKETVGKGKKRKLSKSLSKFYKTENGKKKIKRQSKNMKGIMKKKWENKEWSEKQIQLIFNVLNKKPNSYEQKIIDLCKEHQLPFKYVGDGQVFIARKNPDFIDCNGQKLIIEVYHSYHKIKTFGSVRKYKINRTKLFRKYGYKTLYLDENDLSKEKWNKIKVLNKIQQFVGDKNLD